MTMFILDLLGSFQYLIGISRDFDIAAFSLDPSFILGFLELRYSSMSTSDKLTYLDQTHYVKNSTGIDSYFVQINVITNILYTFVLQYSC